MRGVVSDQQYLLQNDLLLENRIKPPEQPILVEDNTAQILYEQQSLLLQRQIAEAEKARKVQFIRKHQ